MLKLNASFSKKVPADVEFSSKGYSATIEIELPDGLNQEQLQGRIHDTFMLVKSSVENELSGTTKVIKPSTQATASANNNTRPYQNSNNSSNYSKSNKSEGFASPKQIKYLCDLARKGNIPLNGYLQNYGHAQASELNRQECSSLIDMIRKQVA